MLPRDCASYARDKAISTIRDVNISDNTVARGSVVVVYSSTLYTDSVVFSDATKASDLSAVQLDKTSTYIGQEIAFNGFEGEVGARHVRQERLVRDSQSL